MVTGVEWGHRMGTTFFVAVCFVYCRGLKPTEASDFSPACALVAYHSPRTTRRLVRVPHGLTRPRLTERRTRPPSAPRVGFATATRASAPATPASPATLVRCLSATCDSVRLSSVVLVPPPFDMLSRCYLAPLPLP